MALNFKVCRDNKDVFQNAKQNDTILFSQGNTDFHIGHAHSEKSAITIKNDNDIVIQDKVTGLFFNPVTYNFINYDIFTPPKTLWWDANYFFVNYETASDNETIGNYDNLLGRLEMVQISKFPCTRWYPRFETGCLHDVIVHDKKFLNENIRNRFIMENENDNVLTSPKSSKTDSNENAIHFNGSQYLILQEEKPNPTNVWIHVVLLPQSTNNQTFLSFWNTKGEQYCTFSIKNVDDEHVQFVLDVYKKKLHSKSIIKSNLLSHKSILTLKSIEIENNNFDFIFYRNGILEDSQNVDIASIDNNAKIEVGADLNGFLFDLVFDSQREHLSILGFLLYHHKIMTIKDVYNFLETNNFSTVTNSYQFLFYDTGFLQLIDKNDNIMPLQKHIQMYQNVTVSLLGGEGMFQHENPWFAIMNAITYLHKYKGGTIHFFPGEYLIDRPIAFIHIETYDYSYYSNNTASKNYPIEYFDLRYIHSSIKPYWINVNNICLRGHNKENTKIVQHGVRTHPIFFLFNASNITIENLTITSDAPSVTNTEYYEFVPKRRYINGIGWKAAPIIRRNLNMNYLRSRYFSGGMCYISNCKSIYINNCFIDGKNYVKDQYHAQIDPITYQAGLGFNEMGYRHCFVGDGNKGNKNGMTNFHLNNCTIQNFGWDIISDKSDNSTGTKVTNCLILDNFNGLNINGDNAIIENTIIDFKGRAWSMEGRIGITTGPYWYNEKGIKNSKSSIIRNCRILNGPVGIRSGDGYIINCYIENCMIGIDGDTHNVRDCIIKNCQIGTKGKGTNSCHFINCDVPFSRSLYLFYRERDTNNTLIPFAYNFIPTVLSCKKLFAFFDNNAWYNPKKETERSPEQSLIQFYFNDKKKAMNFEGYIDKCKIQDMFLFHEDINVEVPYLENKIYPSRKDLLQNIKKQLNKTKYKDIVYFEVNEDTKKIIVIRKYDQITCRIRINEGKLKDILQVIDHQLRYWYEEIPLNLTDQEYIINEENNRLSISIYIEIKYSGTYQPEPAQDILETIKEFSMYNINSSIVSTRMNSEDVIKIKKSMSEKKIVLNHITTKILLPENLTFYDNGFNITIINKTNKDIPIFFKNEILFTLEKNVLECIYYYNGEFQLSNYLEKNNISLQSQKQPTIEKELNIQLKEDNSLIFKVKCADGIIREGKLLLS